MNRRRPRLRIYLVLFLIAAGIVGVSLSWKPLLAVRYLAQARRAMFQREYGIALDRLQQADRVRPQHAATHFQMARAFRHLGKADSVNAQMELARKYGCDVQQIEHERWLLMAQLGRMREAEPHLAKLLASSGDDQREACEAYVRGFLANLRLADAQQLLTAWTVDFPDDGEAWFLQGSLYEMTSSYSEAAEAYRRAASLFRGRVDIKLRWSAMLTELRQIEESHRIIGECLATQPDDPAVLLAWSRALQTQGNLTQAKDSLLKLLRIAPEHVAGQLLLGEVLLANQEYDQALVWLNSAVAHRPHDSALRYNLAKTLSALGRTSEAQPHLDFVAESQVPLGRIEALVLDSVKRPQDTSLRFEIGSILWKYGSPDDAARWMRSVLELDPTRRDVHQILAEYYRLRGQDELAAHHFQLSNR